MGRQDDRLVCRAMNGWTRNIHGGVGENSFSTARCQRISFYLAATLTKGEFEARYGKGDKHTRFQGQVLVVPTNEELVIPARTKIIVED
jgi:acetate kinase